MRLFYKTFPIRDALRHELSWTHYRALLRIEGESARSWYMNEAASQGWTTRALERQISTLYYERLLATSDRGAVEGEAQDQLKALHTPRDFVRDPVMLEFLGAPGTGRLLEADLERALLDNLQAFLLELGRGFAFVARQYRLSTESKDFFVDLVFYNFLLKCFVLFELKLSGFGQQLALHSPPRAGQRPGRAQENLSCPPEVPYSNSERGPVLALVHSLQRHQQSEVAYEHAMLGGDSRHAR